MGIMDAVGNDLDARPPCTVTRDDAAADVCEHTDGSRSGSLGRKWAPSSWFIAALTLAAMGGRGVTSLGRALPGILRR